MNDRQIKQLVNASLPDMVPPRTWLQRTQEAAANRLADVEASDALTPEDIDDVLEASQNEQ